MSEAAGYAVIKAGGTQHRVVEGETLRIEKLEAEPGSEVVFPEVLVLSAGGRVSIGTPHVAGAKVVGEVVRQGKGKKIRIYRFKRKKGYQRTLGHRQRYTLIKIKVIEAASA